MGDLLLASAVELARRVRSGELGAAELIERTLERVDALNPTLNALVTLDPAALDRARELDSRIQAGEDPGLLAGLPVGIKDVTPVAGLRTTYGSMLHAEHVSDQDAVVVQRLRAAGAVLLGKTNTPEFATGANTDNEVFGPTRNPWNVELSAGGSTGGGAAALATGMIALAEGTDLGGSLRIPASFCGVVGLRPSPGVVPTVPSDFPWDSLSVSGPMARTAEDVALAMDAMAGPHPLAPLSRGVEGRRFRAAMAAVRPRALRCLYCEDPAAIGIDNAVARVCRQAFGSLRASGVEIQEIELDLSFAVQAFHVLRGLWMVTHHLDRLERREELGDNLRGNIEDGLGRDALQIARAERDRARLCRLLADLFESADLLITPTMAVPPFPVEENHPALVGGREMSTYVDWIAPTFVFSLAGLPVASVPCGVDASGLPVGLQLVAAGGGEDRALAMAQHVQSVCRLPAPPILVQL